MRLLADENIQTSTVRMLQDHGHDVVSIREAGLAGAPDGLVFRRAQADDRVVLTFNMDFADLRELAEMNHSGIIRLRVSDQRAAHLHPILQAALSHLAATDLRNVLVTISDQRTRVRKTGAP